MDRMVAEGLLLLLQRSPVQRLGGHPQLYVLTNAFHRVRLECVKDAWWMDRRTDRLTGWSVSGWLAGLTG